MSDYNPSEIEGKWQKKWAKDKIFEATDKKPKFFVLDMFPYPSGDGLHVGHPRGYVGSDVISHYMRMKGFNVLHPMGLDAFGLPAENYAIKTKIHPAVTTKKNIKRFKEQMNMIGLSYDWTREINTTDPEYYKWTQWIFLKLFDRGLAYIKELPINWCPSCKTGLANEEVVNGKCERCGAAVTKKNIKQWVLKITDYAEELLTGLEDLDWPEKIKEMQRNWIGKSEGADIDFKVGKEVIKVFTTRPDTIFGATFMVLAPEHELVEKITIPENKEKVEEYIKESKNKLDIERQENRHKTGVFTGAYALNPATKEKIPVYIADYVLPHYGYGAIMAVPAYDERDEEFAKKYKIEIRKAELTKKLFGKKTINYKLRDWIFSRQRYWGEPIPLVFCENCVGDSKGEKLNPGYIAIRDFPVELPELEDFKPTGESPLAGTKWVETTCPKCGGKAIRETNTMPQWAGSCWYFIRYLDPKNKEEIADKKLIKHWLPVDFYIGGAEHAVLHLLYSRFWIKVLRDEKVLLFGEPFKKLRTIGLILAPDGQKMSKSRGNVINPDEIVEKYGADAFRLYEMFMGPFDQAIAWDSKGILGVKRFLEKVWKLKVVKTDDLKIDKVVKKVTQDIEAEKFNTAIAAMMEFINSASKGITKKNLETFLKILAPFAPHIAEEMWNKKTSILQEKWPSYKEVKEKEIEIVVQVNGKVRASLKVEPGLTEAKIKELALQDKNVKKWVKEVKKTIFIKDKLINFVV